jgi:hypothetical protein
MSVDGYVTGANQTKENPVGVTGEAWHDCLPYRLTRREASRARLAPRGERRHCWGRRQSDVATHANRRDTYAEVPD